MDLGIAGIGDAVELGSTPALTTYRATDSSGRAVIVKVLARDATPEVWARFDYDQTQVRALQEHPNIVSVLGHGVTPANKPYVVTSYVEGGSMAEVVGSGGLDGPGVLSLGVRVAGALESAHRRNVVHGDLRPEDIMVDPVREPEVADFGIVMATGYGPDRAEHASRLAHVAPEQLDTHVPTPATDIYALGSVLYALLAGAPAFVRPTDDSPLPVAVRIKAEPPPDLRGIGVPEAVAAVVERALAKDPAERWPTAEAFGIALQQAEITFGRPITPMVVLGPDRPGGAALDDTTAVPPTTALGAAAGGPPPAQGGPSGPPPGGAPPGAPARSKGPLVVAAVVVAAVLGIGGFLLLGGDGGDDGRAPVTLADGSDETDDTEPPDTEPPDTDDTEPPDTEPPDTDDTQPPAFDLRTELDDTGSISLSAPDFWPAADGASINLLDDAQNVVGTAADLVVSATPASGNFTTDPALSGIEVTFFQQASLDQFGITQGVDLANNRVSSRGLDGVCATAGAPEDEELAGFTGSLLRFTDCDAGQTLFVFGGIGAGGGIVVEVHVVNADDEAVLPTVLDSVLITP